MQAPKTVDLNLYEDARYRGRFYVWEDSAQQVPVALIGYSARMQIRPGFSDQDALTLELTSEANDITVDSSGYVDVVIPGEKIVESLSGQVYDLFVVGPAGERFVIAHGSVSVTPAVTRF